MPTLGLENKNLNSQNLKGLPRKQKIAVVFLAVLAILIIVVWAVQFSMQINKPFRRGDNVNKTETASTTSENAKDSDGDGLLDYDEVNTYGTSPYLEDSDSDGISDKQEITQGTDPNCPTGKDCNSSEATTGTANTSGASSSVDILGLDSLELDALGASSGSTAASGSVIEVTPALIRQELLNGGVKQEDLDKISDEELIKIYEESISKESTNE